MKRVHIIGGKNHGKTTLVVDLVRELTEQGVRVGTIKHTHHQHELDTPGKDSHRHRLAGAAVVGICSPSMNAVFWPPGNHDANENDSEQKYSKYQPMFEHCDLILVEGDSQTSAPKVEVWRDDVGTPPMALHDASIKAVITDDRPTDILRISLWPRSDVATLAANVRLL